MLVFFQGNASDLEKGLLVYRLQFFWDTNIRLGEPVDSCTAPWSLCLMMATLCRVETFLYLLFCLGVRKELAYSKLRRILKICCVRSFSGLGIIMCFAYHKWDEFVFLDNSRFVPPFFNSRHIFLKTHYLFLGKLFELPLLRFSCSVLVYTTFCCP